MNMRKKSKEASDGLNPDKILIKNYLNGSYEDFNILYERYRGRLYGYLHKMMPGQSSTVDDIFQQTWIKVIKSLKKYDEKNKFFAWLARIAHNLMVDHFRKEKKNACNQPIKEHEFHLRSYSGYEHWQEMDRKIMNDLLKKALKKLKPQIREVFMLRCEDLSFKKIAKIQNCSINTALARMRYASVNIKNYMENLIQEYKQNIKAGIENE